MIIKRLSAITNEIKGIRMNYGGTKNAIEFFLFGLGFKKIVFIYRSPRERKHAKLLIKLSMTTLIDPNENIMPDKKMTQSRRKCINTNSNNKKRKVRVCMKQL